MARTLSSTTSNCSPSRFHRYKPASSDTSGGSSFGLVLRTDMVEARGFLPLSALEVKDSCFTGRSSSSSDCALIFRGRMFGDGRLRATSDSRFSQRTHLSHWNSCTRLVEFPLIHGLQNCHIDEILSCSIHVWICDKLESVIWIVRFGFAPRERVTAIHLRDLEVEHRIDEE